MKHYLIKKTSMCIGIFTVMLVSSSFATMRVSNNTTLTADVYEDIVIESDGITLDLNGYSVIGNNSSKSGITVYERENVTITSSKGYARIVGFYNGVYIQGSTKIKLSSLGCLQNNRGLYINRDSEIEVYNVKVALSNYEGVRMISCGRSNISYTDCFINGEDGFYTNCCYGIDIDNSRQIYNGGSGVTLELTESFNFDNCESNNNCKNGIFMKDTCFAHNVSACVMNGNVEDGLKLRFLTDKCKFTCCTGINNWDGNLDEKVKEGCKNTFVGCNFP